jgi:hypothetical protein
LNDKFTLILLFITEYPITIAPVVHIPDIIPLNIDVFSKAKNVNNDSTPA